jgi:hypothetical protein
MGESYQTVLVVGELGQVKDVLAAADVDGLVMPAGAGRTAVIPKEGHSGYVDPANLAKLVSARAGFRALSNEVSDSDVLLMYAFHDGRLTHEYVSDQAMLVDWFIDDDGTTRFRLGDIEYPADASYPQGPRGADAAMFTPFGVAPLDLSRLGAALRGENEGGGRLSPEAQHVAILSALNLDPRSLTAAFRWTRVDDLPGAVRIKDLGEADASLDRRLTIVIVTGLPLDADPTDVCQVIADTIKQTSFRMHANVGYLPVIPEAARAEQITLIANEHLAPSPRRATFFVELLVTPPLGFDFDDQSFAAAATRVWRTALPSRYGLGDGQGPFIGIMAPGPFAVGFAGAEGIRSTRRT